MTAQQIPKSPQRGVEARTQNKLKRRQKIMDLAREMIANDGFDTFTIAKLAATAEVTIPTVHNLIGNKSVVLKKLVEEMVVRIEDVFESEHVNHPITAVRLFIDNLIALFAKDENFYRAAFVVGEQQKLFEHRSSSGIFRKSLEVAHKICEQALTNGYLLGNIDSWFLAEQLFANQRLARHDWVHGYINLEEYRNQVLCGMLITFSADASPEFKGVLLGEIKQLSAHMSIQNQQ